MDMDPALPALYIGQTATDPEVRFQQHKWGHRASRVVSNFGLHLWPGAEDIPGLKDIPTRDEAERMEAAVVRDLRRNGHCVADNESGILLDFWQYAQRILLIPSFGVGFRPNLGGRTRSRHSTSIPTPPTEFERYHTGSTPPTTGNRPFTHSLPLTHGSNISATTVAVSNLLWEYVLPASAKDWFPITFQTLSGLDSAR